VRPSSEAADGEGGEHRDGNGDGIEKGRQQHEQKPGLGQEQQHILSRTHLSQHNLTHSNNPPLENIVVRIEVKDTGIGIRRRDMVQSKLFCEWWSLSFYNTGLNGYP
jgi:hypothetical protein